MRVGVLRAVDRVSRGFHPAQGIAGVDKILGQRVGALAPLRSLIAGETVAQVAGYAGLDVDDLQAAVGMIGIAKNAASRLVRGDVPGVVVRDGRDFAGG